MPGSDDYQVAGMMQWREEDCDGGWIHMMGSSVDNKVLRLDQVGDYKAIDPIILYSAVSLFDVVFPLCCVVVVVALIIKQLKGR